MYGAPYGPPLVRMSVLTIPPAMSATACQKSPRVQRGGPHPNSDLPYAKARHPGEEKQSLLGRMVLERCAGSTTDEAPTYHLDSKWSPPDSPGSTFRDDDERWM